MDNNAYIGFEVAKLMKENGFNEKYGFKGMDEYVPYPCLECPFNCYSPKK